MRMAATSQPGSGRATAPNLRNSRSDMIRKLPSVKITARRPFTHGAPVQIIGRPPDSGGSSTSGTSPTS